MSDGSRDMSHSLEVDLKNSHVTGLMHRLDFDTNQNLNRFTTASRAITGSKTSIYASANVSAMFQIKLMCRGPLPELVGEGQNCNATSCALASGLRDV